MSYYRSVSAGERAFHLARETGTWSRKFIQVILEGEGALDLRKWQAALRTLGDCHPGARLVLRGHLGFSQWDSSGPVPSVSEVFANWDGFDFDRAPFLWRAPVDIRRGPLGEVLLIQGRTPRVLMRVHHAVMDGVGALTLAQDLFRILRGEEPLGANSTRTELDVWRGANFGSGKMATAPPNAIVPFERGEGNPEAPFVWKRLRIPGHISRLVPKLAVGVAEESRRIREGAVRIAVFVNLRRHLAKGEVTLANCTSMILVDVARGDTTSTMARKIGEQLRARTYLNMNRHVGLARWVPRALFKPSPRSIAQSYRTGLFRMSAFITHIGAFTPELYSCPDFRATRLIPVSPCDPTTPLNLVICEAPDGVEIVGNAPAPLAGNRRLEHLMEGLRERLMEGHAAIAS